MMRKLFLSGLAALGLAVSSQATPVLVIWDDAGHTQTIYDNLAGDFASGSGQIAWVGSIGVWNLDVSVGVTTGSSANPILDLSSSSTSTGAGVLSVWYGDNNFGSSAGSVNATIGGTLLTGASLNFFSAYNLENDPIGASFVLTNGQYSGNPFSGSETASFNPSGPYALVDYVVLTHTRAGTSSYDAMVSVPESGSTAILMSFGLIGLGLVKRRNKSSRA